METTIKVGLVEDHVLLRKGLTTLLRDKGFAVTLEANNGQQLIYRLDNDSTPDVILLDISMPVMDGYATAKWLHEKHPLIKIIALTMWDDELSIIRMIRNGAGGYLLKDCESDELINAIRTVHAHGVYHSELVSAKLIQSMQSPHAITGLHITEREMDFIRLACSERTYKEIGRQMGVSTRTAEGCRDALFRKLGLKSRVGLVMYAMKHHLVPSLST